MPPITISNETFKDFLFTEYENIAKAHFESAKQMALFFRYYTIFFSVPIILASVWKDSTSVIMNVEMFGYLLIVVSVIGISFYWVTIDLKHEAVLYARTVNGIRHYFYQNVDPETEAQIRILPKKIDKPSYYSPGNPVLLIMMFVNSVYLLLGFKYLECINVYTILCVSFVFLFHIFLNYILSRKQEKKFTS